MTIEDKCKNCGKPNLIKRPWRNDIWCGWCGTEYDKDLNITKVRNTHTEIVKTDRNAYYREYQKRRYSTKKLVIA